LIEAPEGVFGEDARVIFGQVEADVECLFGVDFGLCFVEAFIAFGAPAAKMGGVQDRDFLLASNGQIEEFVCNIKYFRSQFGRYARILENKEAGIAASGADVLNKASAIRCCACPVNYGDHVGAVRAGVAPTKRSILRETRSRCFLREASVDESIR